VPDSVHARSAVVIDDDPEVQHLLAEILTGAGFITRTADNGLDGIAAVRDHQPLLTTLDVDMPGIDGYETARRIREASDTYIVLITALADETDAVLGFGAGADDVVVKPFRVRELRARFLAIARRPPARLSNRFEPSAVEDDEIRYDGLVLDRHTRSVSVDGLNVELTRTEFDLLATILESERRVRSKVDLVLSVREDSHASPTLVTYADERTIEAHITNLRRKLGESAAQPRFIETVRGVGYRAIVSRQPLQRER